MGYEVPKHHVDQFKANVMHLTQQKKAILDPVVKMTEPFTGKKFRVDRIGSTRTQKREGRFQDTKYIGTPHDSRWGTAETFDWAEMIDQIDKLKMLYDPASPYVTAAASGFARTRDDIIILAAFDDVLTGEEGKTTVSFPDTQVLEEDGTDGLTLAKLLDAQLMKEEANVDPDLKWYYVGSPFDKKTLLNTTEVKSSDYNTVKALVNGEINEFLGFEFLWTTRLQMNTSTHMYYNFAFCEDAFVKGVQQEMQARADELPTKNYAHQLWASMTRGCVRMEEVKVIKVETYDVRIGDTVFEVERNGSTDTVS